MPGLVPSVLGFREHITYVDHQPGSCYGGK
jgi:hypothetical protein